MSELRVITVFGQVVRDLRKARGWSQERLAEASALDRTFLSQLETGRKQPSLLTIVRLATALQLPSSELLRLLEEKLG